MMDKTRRRIEVLREGVWLSTRMRYIVEGDKYRMFEPDGRPVIGTGKFEGVQVFQAIADAEETDKNVWGVRSVPIEEE